MSAQRNDRSSNPRSGKKPPSDHAPRGSDDWEKMQQGAAPNPKHSRVQQQNQDSWNVRQDPEHPERPADGGEREMRGNSGTNEQQSGDPDSPDQPESGDRGRGSSRRMES